jgi:hypothetical protein
MMNTESCGVQRRKNGSLSDESKIAAQTIEVENSSINHKNAHR